MVAARSKAKAKPQPRELVGTTTIPLRERRWIDIEPSKQDLDSYDLSKKVIDLLQHNQTLHREEDGAIDLRNHHSKIQNWFDDRWKACLAAGGNPNEDISAALTIWEQFSVSEFFKDILESNLQDNVLIGPGIFPHICRVGSTFNLHSIISNGLVLGGQNLSRRQTVFFKFVDPRDESHRDPEFIDCSAPHLARYMHSAWKRHQDAVFWVDIDLGIKEGKVFY